MREQLGRWFDAQQERSKGWLILFIIFLALILAANFVIHPVGGHGGGHGEAAVQTDAHGQAPAGHGEAAVKSDEHGEAPAAGHGAASAAPAPHGFWDMPAPHFGYDYIPGFFALFGFLGAVFMVVFVKKMVQPVIEVPEDPDDV